MRLMHTRLETEGLKKWVGLLQGITKGNDDFLFTEAYGKRFRRWRNENAVFILARGWSILF